MTPTEDDCTNRMTSTKESPAPAVVVSMKILEESCRVVVGSNAPKWPKSRFANHCNCFFPLWHCRGVKP